MRINLKTAAGQDPQHTTLTLSGRLPVHVLPPCTLDCTWHVSAAAGYYLIDLRITGNLVIACQRCLHEFTQEYTNKTILAACLTEAIAEKEMQDYECIVTPDHEVDLAELVIDDLFLYSPENHADKKNCDREIDQYIQTGAS